MSGCVIDVQVFTREGIGATSAPSRSSMTSSGCKERFADQLRIVEADTFGRIERVLTGKTAAATEEARAGHEDHERISTTSTAAVVRVSLTDERPRRSSVAQGFLDKLRDFDKLFESSAKAHAGRRTPPGVRRW
jgi:DNA-directed RNA polymerase subunit beta